MDTFFVPKSIAETNVQKRFEDEKAQRRKPNVSIGKLSNYQFDKASVALKNVDSILACKLEKYWSCISGCVSLCISYLVFSRKFGPTDMYPTQQQLDDKNLG
jgi:hypothetical protein